MQLDSIAVHPPKAVFNVYSRDATFTVTNVSKKSTRVHVIRPISSFFGLSHSRPVSFLLAPGLQFKVHVHSQGWTPESTDHKPQNIFDRILIRTDAGELEVPLVFEVTRPSLQLGSRVTLDPVPIGQKTSTVVQIRNEGRAEGEFNLVGIGGEARDEQIKITPNKGVIPGHSHADVEIEVQSTSPMIVKRIVAWQLDDRLHHMDLTAEFAESKFDLVSSQQILVTNPIDFGMVLMGATIEQAFTLINSSPVKTKFSIRIEQKSELELRRTDGDQQGLKSSQLKIERESEPAVLSAIPAEGVLLPYEAIPLCLRYSPQQAPIIKGFKSQIPAGQVLHYNSTMTIEAVDEPGRVSAVAITGSASEPDFAISLDRFSFGACPVNEYRDVIVTIANRSEALDLPFKTQRLAHFKCDPVYGTIPASKCQDLVVSFRPHQLGLFQATIAVELGFNVVVPIEVVGRSSTIGKTRRRLTGPQALPVDFKRELNLVEPLPYEKLGTYEAPGASNSHLRPPRSPILMHANHGRKVFRKAPAIK